MHDGYFWLCYEWSNLLPACITCNREGAKHTKFPIIDNRVKSPPLLKSDGTLDFEKFDAKKTPLIDEIPYLLHPEIDNPVDYFDFGLHKYKDAGKEKIVGIELIGKDVQGRGEKTIEICKLNRNELIIHRKIYVIDPFIDAVKALFGKLENKTISDSEFDNKLIYEVEKLGYQSKVGHPCYLTS